MEARRQNRSLLSNGGAGVGGLAGALLMTKLQYDQLTEKEKLFADLFLDLTFAVKRVEVAVTKLDQESQ